MPDAPKTNPSRPSRRRVLRALGAGLGLTAVAGVYSWQIEPFWPEFCEIPMDVTALPAAFVGMRITQLTDLHVSDAVPYSYLARVIEEVNRIGPDWVVVTGDVVTHGSYRIDDAARLLARLRAPTVVTFGNHDDGRLRGVGLAERDVATALESALRAVGCRVLRNASMPIERGSSRIWLVGLEDLWTGRFSPSAALAGVPRSADEPMIALSHNPDTAPALDSYGVQWILSGHTHGGQVRLPGYGAIMLPVQNRQWQRGLYELSRSKLYVSRGVGFLFQSRFACRPEVPTFTLRTC
jgi:predicted MPP superfamily phosphohydrolase